MGAAGKSGGNVGKAITGRLLYVPGMAGVGAPIAADRRCGKAIMILRPDTRLLQRNGIMRKIKVCPQVW